REGRVLIDEQPPERTSVSDSRARPHRPAAAHPRPATGPFGSGLRAASAGESITEEASEAAEVERLCRNKFVVEGSGKIWTSFRPPAEFDGEEDGEYSGR
ncbi:MAG: hypothetical protein M3177_09335, partial [Pseudomonadota bacterium]|nr:hypothetical protein [Pseudomonadota bacterium]